MSIPAATLSFGKKDGEFFLEATQTLPRPRAEVFPFFADARNLEALTPPSLSFQILTPTPIAMVAGTQIDYRLKLHGFPLRWRSEIRAWEPPHRFVDFQLRGPYQLWHHEHLFETVELATGEGTRVIDRVRYRLLGGFLLEPLFVRPDLRRIFGFRQRELARRFGGEQFP